MASNKGMRAVKLRSSLRSDVGMVRDHNEDSAYADEDATFFVVADGMGGHAAGEVASAMAVDNVRVVLEEARVDIDTFSESPSEDARQKLVSVLEGAVREAHRAVYERGVAEPDKQGMGTTLDVVLVAGNEAFIAHVGDSRTYLIREGRASQITTDHTVAEVLVIEGKLSTEEAQASPLRTILVNAIGVAPEVGVEMAHLRLRRGDKLLLCSDGLHDYFPAEQELAKYLSTADPEGALVQMVDLAKDRGGHDNITGVVLEVLEAPEDDDEKREADQVATLREPASGVPHEIGRDDTLPVESRNDDQAKVTGSTSDTDSEDAGEGKKKSKGSKPVAKDATAANQDDVDTVEDLAAQTTPAEDRATLKLRLSPEDDARADEEAMRVFAASSNARRAGAESDADDPEEDAAENTAVGKPTKKTASRTEDDGKTKKKGKRRSKSSRGNKRDKSGGSDTGEGSAAGD